MNYVESLKESLNEIQKEQANACGKNTRAAVLTIVGTVWGFLIGKANIIMIGNTNHALVLIMIIAMACAFLGLDAWRHYSVANEARKLHRILIIEDEDPVRVEARMNKKSDWSFKVFKYQLLLGLIMVVVLITYSILLFNGLL